MYLPRAGPRTREWARRNGFDAWRVARLARLVPEQSGRFLNALLETPPDYLRINPLRADDDEICKRLEARDFKVAPTGLDPHILRVRDAPISIGATQEHLLGYTTPQDLASAAAPIALEARPGDVVLDLAAAPGIKTLHMAGDMDNQGALVAVEPDPDRMRALRFNLERCGVSNTVMRLHGGQETPGEAWADKVLLDAPCTGEGTLPKDRKRRRGSPEETPRLAALQTELLDAADRCLRPGGTLVYATCTFAPEENEAQVQHLLDRGYRLQPLPFDACAGAPLVPALTAWGETTFDPDMDQAKRFLPGLHPTLGFFVAKLEKPEAAP